SWLRWRKGSVEVKRYWRLDYSEKFTEPEAELREEMLRLLREALKIRLESEVPLGAFLSGGVDSSAVVAFAAEAMSEPLKTFSIGFEPGAFDESPYARIVAEKFGTDHHELRVDEGTPQLLVQLRPKDPYEAYYATLTHLTPRRKPWLYTSDGLRALMETPSPPLALMQGKAHRTLLDAMLEADVNWYLPDDLLVKMDVAT